MGSYMSETFFFTLLLLWQSSKAMAVNIYFMHIPNINIFLFSWFKPEEDNRLKDGCMVGNHTHGSYKFITNIQRHFYFETQKQLTSFVTNILYRHIY